VATVVAGVTMETAGGGPEVSTVGATVVEDEGIWTGEEDVDREQEETVDSEDDTVVAIAVWAPLVARQFVAGTAAA